MFATYKAGLCRGCLLASTFLLAVPASAGITSYNASALFSAAASNLSTQDFAFIDSVSPSGSNGSTSINDGLSSATNSHILPGISISSLNHAGLALLGSTYAGNLYNPGGGPAILPGGFGGMEFTYGPSVTAASLDVYGVFSHDGRNGGFGYDVVVSVYSDTSSLLGSFTVHTPDTIQFFGVTTDGGDKIGKIDITPGGFGAGITGLQFNHASPVPEFSSLFSFSGLLVAGGAGAWLRRRHHKSAHLSP